MREAERRGDSAATDASEAAASQAPVAVATDDPVLPSVSRPQENSTRQLTRRELRERGLVEQVTEEPARVSAPAEVRPGSRRSLRSSPAIPVEAPKIDVPEPEFTGQNLLSEPSTAAIVLERAPEAIELPIQASENTTTGSIQVITGPMDSATTSTVDSIALDDELSEDAVTGVLSTVEPISALDLIGERSATGVVPGSVLRKGWWKPLLLALLAIALAAATIWATVTITEVVGN